MPLLTMLFLFSSAFAHASPTPSSHEISKKGFTPSHVCASCHQTIAENWKGSMHANATVDPIFYTVFLEASHATNGKTDVLCLSCHAPTTRLTKETDLQNPLVKEGVNCDFCHSVTGVHLSSSETLDVAPSQKKWGPIKGANSPVHETGYSPLFEQAEFCGSCHQYTNEHGVAIFDTYAEWKKSPQAKLGETCQTCHMPKRPGLIARSDLHPNAEHDLHSHEAAGGHSAETIKKSVTLKIGDARRSGEKIHVVVAVHNVGSGHKVPTGLPTRKLILHFKANASGQTLFAVDRIYQKVLTNQRGEAITKDVDIFLAATKVQSDNRLTPGEQREEHFTFYAPEDASVEIEASLEYWYQPRIIQESEMSVKIAKEKKIFTPGKQ
ncbi:MAG: hypothetical protein HY540_03295 [Deltaproteobacteria bacterium]|nr:hypothetical protein [Deltaproteobacteria bacterium]